MSCAVLPGLGSRLWWVPPQLASIVMRVMLRSPLPCMSLTPLSRARVGGVLGVPACGACLLRGTLLRCVRTVCVLKPVLFMTPLLPMMAQVCLTTCPRAGDRLCCASRLPPSLLAMLVLRCELCGARARRIAVLAATLVAAVMVVMLMRVTAR